MEKKILGCPYNFLEGQNLCLRTETNLFYQLMLIKQCNMTSGAYQEDYGTLSALGCLALKAVCQQPPKNNNPP